MFVLEAESIFRSGVLWKYSIKQKHYCYGNLLFFYLNSELELFFDVMSQIHTVTCQQIRKQALSVTAALSVPAKTLTIQVKEMLHKR